MINFTQAFDTAWERMVVILFRPFDFGKWCAIGLSAFLAGLLAGGNGFNSSYNQNFDNNPLNKYSGTQTPKLDLNHVNTAIAQAFAGMQAGIIIALVIIVLFFVLALVCLMYWLGARGQFLFMDNLVRNRGAIAWPWTTYARQANSVFFLYLIFMAIAMLTIVPIIVLGVFMSLPLIREHRWPAGAEIGGFAAVGLAYFVVAVVLGVIMFLFREFGTAIMFRQGLLARPAFMETLKLVARHPGTVVLFVLLRIAIFVGVVVLSLILCCVTIPCCCLSQWPYLGTVVLLPVLVYVRCFTLECLAQFGPEYNVWIVDVPPPSAGNASPFSLPRPPG